MVCGPDSVLSHLYIARLHLDRLASCENTTGASDSYRMTANSGPSADLDGVMWARVLHLDRNGFIATREMHT